MTDEEMADKWVKEHTEIIDNEELEMEYIKEPDPKQAFLAGLKAGRPQWHDLEKDPTDLPKDNHDVWCKALDHYGEGWYDKDTNTWTLIYRGYHLHCIEAWCEIPTFDKE